MENDFQREYLGIFTEPMPIPEVGDYAYNIFTEDIFEIVEVEEVEPKRNRWNCRLTDGKWIPIENTSCHLEPTRWVIKKK